ncbi:hypothetical protein GCM10009569_15310 [Arthrobacter russicus]
MLGDCNEIAQMKDFHQSKAYSRNLGQAVPAWTRLGAGRTAPVGTARPTPRLVQELFSSAYHLGQSENTLKFAVELAPTASVAVTL